MARSNYQYETSPRKIQPEYNPRRKKTKIEKNREKIEIKENENQRRIALKQEKRRHHKNIAMIIGIFLILLTISYRNSLITERFNEIQDKKEQLAATEKTNGQLKVSIESSLNLKNVEKSAKKNLGMQKLENDQKVYITLPKEDYTESATEELKQKDDKNFFEKIIEFFK